MACRFVAGLVVGLAGCGETPAAPLSSSGSAPPSSAAATLPAPRSSSTPQPVNSLALPVDPVPWVGIPRKVEEVEQVINPKGDKPYAGKTGTLKGTITIKGKDITLDGSGKINVKASGDVIVKGSKVTQN